MTTTTQIRYTTIRDLEQYWGSEFSDWGLLGSTTYDPAETIRFAERDDEPGVWDLQREQGGEWYNASDDSFGESDVPPIEPASVSS